MNVAIGQVLRFLIVGGLATLTDALLFTLLVTGGLDPRLANMISFPLSAVLAFLLHRHWTFAARAEPAGGQALRFTLMCCAGLTLSTSVVWALAPQLGPLPAKAIAICGTVVLNFSLSRWLVFRRSATAMS
ncbi:GtrA family protein [Sphingomonas sp. PR090111-T3T-6A]|uniref:GtrA family protein n=1 Tax=Sphingomonas sp. PR090111-T3T-6A TaxID=685778 RepID=UPI000360509D|nr:GtrA family protein [Sphingomonas sp. PR090111-T3T-6A]